MTSSGWISDSLGSERVKEAWTEASRRRLYKSLGLSESGRLSDDDLRFTAAALELQVFDLLEEADGHDNLCRAAAEAFQIARSLSWPADPLCAGEWLVRLGCLSVLGDRAADFRRALAGSNLPPLPIASESWDARVWASILDVWLRLLRKQGWDDLDQVQARVAALRRDQREREPELLRRAEQARDASVAWELITSYHLAKAAEVLGVYLSQGSSDGHFDVRQQLEAQFDRAIHAAGLGQLMNQESMARLLARTSQKLVDNSIWTVTRAVNSRVTKFVQTLTARTNPRPIFEMLPPQRKALREEGLLGSGHRSVVVSLPTSAGKTIIAGAGDRTAVDPRGGGRSPQSCIGIKGLEARAAAGHHQPGVPVRSISASDTRAAASKTWRLNISSERKPDVAAMTRCCKSIFGRLTQTASWGLAALQSLTLADVFESLSEGERRAIRNLPAKVYYGVSSDEAVALRLLGVPRMAAGPLAQRLGVRADESLSGVRARVRGADPEVWQEALGSFGASFRRVWRIIEGEQP